jgi:hypothetical protein
MVIQALRPVADAINHDEHTSILHPGAGTWAITVEALLGRRITLDQNGLARRIAGEAHRDRHEGKLENGGAIVDKEKGPDFRRGLPGCRPHHREYASQAPRRTHGGKEGGKSSRENSIYHCGS